LGLDHPVAGCDWFLPHRSQPTSLVFREVDTTSDSQRAQQFVPTRLRKSTAVLTPSATAEFEQQIATYRRQFKEECQSLGLPHEFDQKPFEWLDECGELLGIDPAKTQALLFLKLKVRLFRLHQEALTGSPIVVKEIRTAEIVKFNWMISGQDQDPEFPRILAEDRAMRKKQEEQIKDWVALIRCARLPLSDRPASVSDLRQAIGLSDRDFIPDGSAGILKSVENWFADRQGWVDEILLSQRNGAESAENKKRFSPVPVPENPRVKELCKALKKHMATTPREEWGSQNKFAEMHITKGVERPLTACEKSECSNLLKQARGKFRALWDPNRDWGK
jgi:hypothetical protein